MVTILKGLLTQANTIVRTLLASVTYYHTQDPVLGAKAGSPLTTGATCLHFFFNANHLCDIKFFSSISSVLSIPDQQAIVSPTFKGLLNLLDQAIPLLEQ